MEIYSFITSKDLEKHCRKLQHPFTPMERAYIIWHSANCAIEEKHKAYRNLMEDAPNAAIKNKSPYKSDAIFRTGLHDFLNRYMAAEQKLLQEFYKESADTVYTYGITWDGGAHEDNSVCSYKTFDDCINSIRQYWSVEEDRVVRLTVYKRWLRPADPKQTKWIGADILPGGKNAYRLQEMNTDLLTEEEKQIYDVFDRTWIHVPVPFQKGDIVRSVNPSYSQFSPAGLLPFVFLSVCYEGWDAAKLETRKQFADSSDMTAEGYFLAENGLPFWECMHDYLSLEYYTDPLDGELRLLQAVSNFVKNKIDLSLFLNACSILLTEKQIFDCRKYLCYLDETLKLAGLAKEKI